MSKRAAYLVWFAGIVVLVTCAVLYASLLGPVIDSWEHAKQGHRLQWLGERIEEFHTAQGRYPNDLQELDKSVEHLLVDAWHHPIEYLVRDGQVTLITRGADGIPGGRGMNRDMVYPSERGPRRSLLDYLCSYSFGVALKWGLVSGLLCAGIWLSFHALNKPRFAPLHARDAVRALVLVGFAIGAGVLVEQLHNSAPFSYH